MLLRMPIVQSQWKIMLLGTSIVMLQWIMMLLCVHIIASQCIMTLLWTFVVMFLIFMPNYVILSWIVWTKTRTSSCLISLGWEHIRCFGLFHSSFRLVKYPYTTTTHLFSADWPLTCSCYNITFFRFHSLTIRYKSLIHDIQNKAGLFCSLF